MKTLIAAAVLVLIGCGGEPLETQTQLPDIACNGAVEAESMSFAYSTNGDTAGVSVSVALTLGGLASWKRERFDIHGAEYATAPVSFDSGWTISVDRETRDAFVVYAPPGTTNAWQVGCR